jgi:cold shock CspA family protein
MKTKIQWQLGTVRWFDDFTGKGVITGDDGLDYKVHYSAIESKSKWKNLKNTSKVKFKSLDDPDHRIAEVVLEASK